MDQLAVSSDVLKAIANRDAALQAFNEVEQAIAKLNSLAATAAGAITPEGSHSHDVCVSARVNYHQTANAKTFQTLMDKRLWTLLLDASALSNVMSQRAKRAAQDSIDREPPEFTAENIQSTFEHQFANAQEMEDEGLRDTIKGVSWDYKNNKPHKLGKRLVKRYGNTMYYHGSHGANTLVDLERVFCLADGKTPPPWANSLPERIRTLDPGDEPYTDDYFKIRTFKNGNLHVYFLRSDLVDKINRRLAELEPGALPAKY